MQHVMVAENWQPELLAPLIASVETTKTTTKLLEGRQHYADGAKKDRVEHYREARLRRASQTRATAGNFHEQPQRPPKDLVLAEDDEGGAI